MSAREKIEGMKLGTEPPTAGEYLKIAKSVGERRHPVIEVFGPTIQGEGPLIGAPCYFVRFGGCDYRCDWCDSKYAVDPVLVKENAEMLTAQEIARAVGELSGDAGWVILSGGNPALQHAGEVVDRLHRMGKNVQVETQGTIWRDWLISCEKIVVSPKPPSSGNKTAVEATRMFIDRCRRGQCVLKIVVFDRHDFAYARAVHGILRDVPMFLSVGNDVGVDDLTSLVAKYDELCTWTLGARGMGDVRVLPQMHVLVWGNARGV